MCDFVRVPFSYSPVLDSRFEHESGSGDRTFESQMKDSLFSGKGGNSSFIYLVKKISVRPKENE